MLQLTYRLLCVLSILLIVINSFTYLHILAAEKENKYPERFALYKKTEAISLVPWYYLAAMDQYERNIDLAKSREDPLVSINFPKELWYGLGNSQQINNIEYIELFNGIGKDGNGDGKADPNNPEDILYTTAILLKKNGLSDEDIKISLWDHYKRDLSVKTITNNAKVFKHFQSIELKDRDFPVAIDHNYTYRSTWGAGRGFGGRRIHEGTDIFANYGTPVKSTTYGVVELKGWNLYGGWRIGIRDIFNIYHYYAHLNGYNDEIQVGDIVKPGDVLGSVGSSGYGPPGTSGKFPPHLHYGMYQDNGRNEWSFDPYPYLKRWERMSLDKKSN